MYERDRQALYVYRGNFGEETTFSGTCGRIIIYENLDPSDKKQSKMAQRRAFHFGTEYLPPQNTPLAASICEQPQMLSPSCSL